MLTERKRIFYSSYHNYFDMSSGAAISARAVLLALARRGWRVRVLCGSFFDDGERKFEEFLSDLIARGFRPRLTTRQLTGRGRTICFKVLDFQDGGIESSAVFYADSKERESHCELNQDETDMFLYLYNEEFVERRPDVFMTYGGYKAVALGAAFFRRRDVKTVFYLCNLAYHNRFLFNYFDFVIVPSKFARDEYRKRLGIESVVIPPLIEEKTSISTVRESRYLTFINPSKSKGLDFASFLFRELSKRRADISILMVQGRASLKDVAISLGKCEKNNIRIMRGIVKPTMYYRVARAVIVPSICDETFGRVIVEAGMNRIPCLCSDRGALPDTLGSGGLILSIPDVNRDLKKNVACEKMEAWIQAIVKLWDDENYYQQLCENAFSNSLRFSEIKVESQTTSFFQKILK